MALRLDNRHVPNGRGLDVYVHSVQTVPGLHSVRQDWPWVAPSQEELKEILPKSSAGKGQPQAQDSDMATRLIILGP